VILLKYFEFLSSNNIKITRQIEDTFSRLKIQPVGNGYIDCITMKNCLEPFIKSLTEIGVVVFCVSWWCYVEPDNIDGCPHGMGGPIADYYPGWFSELQNDSYEVDEDRLKAIVNSNDKKELALLNQDTLKQINETLKKPFRYTPTEYIEGNNCVMPALWLLVPDDWKRE
jgi:hypothetical protein